MSEKAAIDEGVLRRKVRAHGILRVCPDWAVIALELMQALWLVWLGGTLRLVE